MASCNLLRRGFLTLGCVIGINSIICASSALMLHQGSDFSQRHSPSPYVPNSKESKPVTSYGQSSFVQNSDSLSGQPYNGKLSVATGDQRPSSINQLSQSDSSATINLIVPTSDKEKKVSRLYNSYISASSAIMDYNEDTRKYMPKNIGRPQTRHLVIPSHSKPSPHRNTWDTDSSLHANESGTTVTSHPWRVPSDNKLKPSQVPKISRTSPRRLHLAIPVRMFVYKRGNTAQNSRQEILGEAKEQFPIAKETLLTSHSSKRIYIPIRFSDDNMLLTTINHRDCVQCPENFTLTPERGNNYVQVPVPEISVCPYLAFVPGRLNVAITSGPKVGSLIKEGEYAVELLVWKKGGHTYSCQFSFRVKLAQCPPLPASNVGSIHCSNGTLWGSQCHIICPQNYMVDSRHSSTKCEGTSESVMWTNGNLKCMPKEILQVNNKSGCTKPHAPAGGTVLCDKKTSGTHYEDGTVCQYFCFPDYVISSQPPNNSLAICHNGQWSPEYEITCSALYCPRPSQPQHGYVLCKELVMQPLHVASSKSKYLNGTVCKFHCEIGYVIPTLELPLDIILCAAPKWNASSIPDCKRAVPPAHHPEDCKNKTWITEPGIKAQTILPRFISSSGLPLTPTCSLPASLSPGIHINFCEATDPEFRATSTCSYHIKVVERIPPQPHPKDCRDKILNAGRSGTALLKPTRFLVTRKESSHVIDATCTYSKKIGIGSYINNCSATDDVLNTTAYCTFTVTVKGLSCPQLPNISNGVIHCHPKLLAPAIYPPHTTCVFKCNDGYVITNSQKKWKKWKCLSKQLQWSQSKIPKCRRSIEPKPYAKDCHHKTLFLRGRKAIWPKKPRFKSAFKEAKVKVRCLLNRPLTAGLYTNFCEAKDTEMRTSTTCSYNITVKAKDCPALFEVPHSELKCSPADIAFGFQVGVVCRYVCHSGYTIPSSLLNYETRKCIAFRKWNTSVLPSCVSKIIPKPTDSSCLHEILTADDPLATNWSVPSFVSSTGAVLKTNCEPPNIRTHGIHSISCSAYDPELRLNGSCEFTVDFRKLSSDDEVESKGAIHCPELPEMLYSKVECSPADTLGYVVGTVCKYVCLPGYIIPSSLQDFVVRNCTDLGNWNITTLPSCLNEIAPYPDDSSCLNQIMMTNDPLAIHFSVPNFISSMGTTIQADCEPSNITAHGVYNILCSAYDTELRLTGSCEFTADIQEPNGTGELDSEKAAVPTPTDSSCLNQVIVTKNLLDSNWTVPNFISSTGVILEAVCEPSSITEYGIHSISCFARDEELDMIGSCQFTVEVSESNATDELDLNSEGCQIPEPVSNSELKCSLNSSLILPLSTVCHYVCYDGYSIPFHQLHLSTIICNSEYVWNITEAPSCEAVSPTFLHPSCPHQSVNTSSPVNAVVEIPLIFTTRNVLANVSCTPHRLEEFGMFEISCEAYDPFFGISAFCTFILTVSQLHSHEILATESVLSITEFDLNVYTPSPSMSCHPLTSPTNGHLNCASNDTSDYCNTSCNSGYHFPFAYHSMGSYSLTCDRSTGLWNFQKDYGIVDVPDCLGELPTTSWQVWLKFKVAVENCSDLHMLTLQNEIQSWLLLLNGNVCNITVDCSQFEYHCGQDDDDINIFALEVTWTVEASFNPEDYENDDEIVPNAETQIEMVLENTQRAITTEQELGDQLLVLAAHLLQDSYRQGKFLLVCQKRGFVVDPQSDKCVECSSGTFEVKGQCKPCPANYYQDKTGQFSCIPCPAGTVSAPGSKSLIECKE